jgi:hypothetical protein
MHIEFKGILGWLSNANPRLTEPHRAFGRCSMPWECPRADSAGPQRRIKVAHPPKGRTRHQPSCGSLEPSSPWESRLCRPSIRAVVQAPHDARTDPPASFPPGGPEWGCRAGVEAGPLIHDTPAESRSSPVSAFAGKSGREMLTMSLSVDDPEQTSSPAIWCVSAAIQPSPRGVHGSPHLKPRDPDR